VVELFVDDSLATVPVTTALDETVLFEFNEPLNSRLAHGLPREAVGDTLEALVCGSCLDRIELPVCEREPIRAVVCSVFLAAKVLF